MKKRVLHVLSSTSYSGAEKVAIDMIELMSDNYDMYYVSPDGSIKYFLELNGIRHIPLKVNSIKELNRVFKEYKPDIVHAHDYRASIKCALSFYPVKIISHIHQNPQWASKINLHSFAYAVSLIRYSNVVFVSNEILQEAIYRPLVYKKSVIIKNHVNEKKVLANANVDNSKISDYDIAFFGRLTDAKDPIRFLKIISEIKKSISGIRGVIIGDGDLKEICLQLIKEMHLQNNVTLLGFQDNPHQYIASSKIILITSKWEGFGLAAVESMVLGKAVFATPAGALKSIVNNEFGLISNDDNELAERIIEVIRNDVLLKEMGEKAKQYSEKYTDQGTWYKNIKKIYN